MWSEVLRLAQKFTGPGNSIIFYINDLNILVQWKVFTKVIGLGVVCHCFVGWKKQINTSNCSRRGLSGDKTAVSWVQGPWTDTDRRFLFVRPRPYSCGEDF